jgi:aspartate/methionine/tyrosine aminotransferase
MRCGRFHQWVTFATSTPFQFAMAETIHAASSNGYYEDLQADYHERRDVLTDVLVAAGLPPLHTAGSFFLMTGFGEHTFANDVDFCRWLIVEIGVTPIPPSGLLYGTSDRPAAVAILLCQQLATLNEAGRRLGKLLDQTKHPA